MLLFSVVSYKVRPPRLVSYVIVVSEKKGIFICEIMMERYIYLRNTQKELKVSNYGQNKSFVFYLFYNGVCLKLLGSLL